VVEGRRTLAACALAAVTGALAAGTLVAVTDRTAADRGAVPRTGTAGSAPTRGAAAPPAGGRTAVEVNGSRVPATGPSTVASVLRAAGVVPRPGVYLSVVRQQRLATGPPARVTVDGHGASPDTPVRPGDRVVVRNGPVQIEPTELAHVRTTATPPSPLYVGGRQGIVRVVRGALSHEVVSRRVVRKPTAGHLVRPRAVALTFDDGPAPGWTPRVLRLLHHHHVHATFCVVGRAAAEHPRLVRAIAAGGNALCDHTWDHDVDLARRSTARITADVRRGARAIDRAGDGIHARFFRAPGGRWSPALDRIVGRQGLTPLRWTVDPRDWTRPGLHSILRTVREELRPGGVILLHDGGGNRSQTVRALRILLHKLRKQGYHFVLPPTG
jgi:peptidoglycan/xylan/chitin deacetylase (PgdA/CDA1 family)